MTLKNDLNTLSKKIAKLKRTHNPMEYDYLRIRGVSGGYQVAVFETRKYHANDLRFAFRAGFAAIGKNLTRKIDPTTKNWFVIIKDDYDAAVFASAVNEALQIGS